jgi:hypothetical protein
VSAGSQQSGAVSNHGEVAADTMTSRITHFIFVGPSADYCVYWQWGALRIVSSGFVSCIYIFHWGSREVTTTDSSVEDRGLEFAECAQLEVSGLVFSCVIAATCEGIPPVTEATAPPARTPFSSCDAAYSFFGGSYSKTDVLEAHNYCFLDCVFAGYMRLGWTLSGAGIYLYHTSAVARWDGCSFINFAIQGNGGAVYINAALLGEWRRCCGDSLWTSAQAAFMHVNVVTEMRLHSTNVRRARSVGDAGSIYMSGLTATSKVVEYTNFTSCYGGGGGAAMYIRGPDDLTVNGLTINECEAPSEGGAFKQWLQGGTGLSTIDWTIFVNCRSTCVFSQEGSCNVNHCRVRDAALHRWLFRRSQATAFVTVTDGLFDRAQPGAEAGIIFTNCVWSVANIDEAATCFLLYQESGCSRFEICPSVTATPSIARSEEETSTSSNTESVTATKFASLSMSEEETITETKFDTQLESAIETQIATQAETKLATPVETEPMTAIVYVSSVAVVSSAQSQADSTEGSSTSDGQESGSGKWIKWIAVTAVLGLAVGAAAVAVICYFFPVRGVNPDKVQGEEESKVEANSRVAAIAPAGSQEQDPAEEIHSDHDLSAGAEHSSGDGKPAESPIEVAQADGKRAAPKKKAKAAAPPVPAPSAGETGGKAAYEISDGVVRLPPVEISSAMGAQTSMSLPFTEQLWARLRYKAQLEPERPELWVSSTKGWMEPGATEFPFNLFFRPSSEKPLKATLLVSVGELETMTEIFASVADDGKKKHRRHRHDDE